MKSSLLAVAIIAILETACAGSSNDILPIPGSITYGGQPRTRLQKSPIGSKVSHVFTDEWAHRVQEVYVVQPDRTLKLVWRQISPASR